MSKYKISWTMEHFYEVEIEADSEDEALDKYFDGDYDSNTIQETGLELQDSVEVEEI